MKTTHAIAVATLVGFAAGAAVTQGLRAQAKAPVYQVSEIELIDAAAYAKEYAPKAQAAIKAAGGKFLAAGGKVTGIEGDAPKSRLVIIQWDSMDQAQAYRASAFFKESLAIRDKYSKFRTMAVEGLAN